MAQTTLPVFKSDDFAVVLGLESSSDPYRNLPEGRELERHNRLLTYVRRNALEPEPQQDVVWSRFCALYLPATIDRLLNLPVPTDATNADERELLLDFTAHNPWHEMLVALQHIPYLAKYLRSSSPIAAAGKRLPQVLADRLAGVSIRWENKMTTITHGEAPRQYYIAAAGNAVQLLSTLCTHFINETDRDRVVSHETQQKLLPILTVWSHRYTGQFLGDVSLRMIAYMSKATKLDEEFNKVRKLYKNWDVCGLPSCSIRKNLKVCGKCQTVRYCSSDHQRKDWSANGGSFHKEFCHKTEY
ncbi:hypothetical protein B0H14DRAFT_2667701 [Mycena olivaceomarginata]|nr:hypothetical protein B0H14DRAFT_2667701 [Mycena olivaceomarginata]